MASINKLFSSLSPDIHRRGRQFEDICKWFLETDPEFKLEIKRVWLWNEWPGRWGRDKGIDLIAETLDGKFWAIQSKCYAPDHYVTKNDLDRFLSETSRPIISYRLLIATRVARVFPNESSLLRLVTALLCETSDDLETGKLYLNVAN